MKHFIIIALIIVAIVAAISLGITYAIATSDLPDWMKFWLLS